MVICLEINISLASRSKVCSGIPCEKIWTLNGMAHRLDGPAVVCYDGYSCWYIYGRHDWLKDGKERIS